MLVLKVFYNRNRVSVSIFKGEEGRVLHLSSLDKLQSALQEQGIHVKVDPDITLKELHRRLDAAL